ncbi:helix-turn-helix domain-containing protein [Microbacterium sp. 179-I 3D4 NHS]|uniref:helix-turn-helix domain-containing protein n=1 Tax=Microbacterium sp. 179-I 3D4 NHS TaxID=3142381 RepID=UPI0039A139BE
MTTDEGSAPISELDAEIGRRVHQALWDQRMTQAVFAAQVGMSQSSVAKRLRGYHGWGAAHLIRAAEALHTSVAYLVGETDDSAPLRITPDAPIDV